MTRSFWLAGAAYILPTFPLGYVWHLVTFRDAYDRLEMYRAEVIIPFGLLSMLIQAAILAGIYPRLFSTRREDWARNAVRLAAGLAAFAWSYAVLPVAAKYRMASVADFLILETGFTLIHAAIVAPLIALAYRDRVQSAASARPAPQR